MQHAAELLNSGEVSHLDVESFDSDNESDIRGASPHASDMNGDHLEAIEELKESHSSGRSDVESSHRTLSQKQSQLEELSAPFGADEAFDIEDSPRKNAIEARRTLS